MKRFFPAWEGCVYDILTIIKLNSISKLTKCINVFSLKNSIYTFLISTLVILNFKDVRSFTLNNKGKELIINIDSIKPLAIGDSLPINFWKDLFNSIDINSPDTIQNINSIDSKLIVIYFWSPLCKPCIESINKLNQIKSIGLEDLIIIPILTNTPLNFAERYSEKLNLKIPLITNSEFINKTYLSNYIPAWGGAWFYQGRLLGVPINNMYDKQIIVNILEGKSVKISNIEPINNYR